MNNWIALSAEAPKVIRDDAGVPVEWTLLHIGENPICQEGRDGAITLTGEDMAAIIGYHRKKGEAIPVDSEHYLFTLAQSKQLDEAETLRLFPGAVAALGYGELELAGDELRIRVRWMPTAYEMLKEKIYKYFSPVIRGLDRGPLRVTSVAMTNTPAINNLDALAASARTTGGCLKKVALRHSDGSDKSDGSDNKDNRGMKCRTQTGANRPRKEPNMGKIEKALGRLLGRDAVALEGEVGEEAQAQIAAEIEAKSDLIEQVKALLGLGAEAGLPEIVAALKAEIERAKEAEAKQKQVDDLLAQQEKQEHDRLVNEGRAEGKITDADMEYVNSLDSKALSAHLAHTSVKVPKRMPIAERTPAPDAAALTAEDRAAIRRLRLDPAKYLNTKQERMK